MEISKNNYEAFFIDYYDGNLTAQQVADLFLFLETHPELKEEFECFNNITLEAGEEVFESRESMKRGTLTEQNISWYLVANREGDLDKYEQKQLEEFIAAHPDFEKDRALFQAATLLSDTSIVFPAKNKLRRPIPFFVAYRTTFQYGIAAALLLLFLAAGSYLLTRVNNRKEIQVAEKPAPFPARPELPLSPVVKPDENRSVPGSETPALPLQAQKTYPASDKLKESTGNEAPMASVNEEQQKINHASSPPVQPVNPIHPGTEPLASITPALELTVEPIQEMKYRTTNVSDIKPVPAKEEFVSVWQALKDISVKELEKRSGTHDSKVLAYADEVPVNAGLVDIVGSGLEKITNDKVQLDRTRNEKGKTERFRFAVGKFSIEK